MSGRVRTTRRPLTLIVFASWALALNLGGTIIGLERLRQRTHSAVHDASALVLAALVLAVVVLTVLKVFFVDVRDHSGIYQTLSFIGLGAVLIGIGWFCQRLLFPGVRSARAPTL